MAIKRVIYGIVLVTGLCIKPSLVEYFKKGTVPSDISEDKLLALLECLEENSIGAGGWLPPQSGRITFFHSATDEVVPYWNLEAVHEMWKTARSSYASYYLSDSKSYYHKSTGVLFLVSNSGTYTEDILSGKWTPVHQDL